jgi:hypothetical protein
MFLIFRTHVFSHSPLSHLFLLQCSSAGLPAAGRRSATAPGPTQAVTGARAGKGSVRAAGQGRVRSRRLFLRAAATGGEGKAARAAGHVRRAECHSPNPIRVAADSCSSAAASSMRGGRPLVPHPRHFNLVPTAGAVPGFPLFHRPCSTVRSAVAHTFD